MSGCPFKGMLNPESYSEGLPYEEFRRLRNDSPVSKLEDTITGKPFWAIMKREDMDFISKNPQLFSSAEESAMPMEYTGSEWIVSDVLRKQMINMDPPEHIKNRRIVRRTFTAKAVDSLKPVLAEHAKNIVDAVAKKGECEFVQEVAAELPLMAILDLLGIDLNDRTDFFNWTNTMIFADDPDMSTTEEEGIEAAGKVCAYAMNLALAHHENPKDDIVGQLLAGSVDGEGLTEEEFMWFFVLLLVGGNESTRTVMAQGMRLLMENPEQLQKLVDDPSLIPGAVEEILRFGTAFICMRRTAMEDVEVGGQLIQKGDKVVMFYHSASMDEDVFGPTANEFDVTRAVTMPELKNEHRAFGIGQHFCIGSHLARMELNLMFEQIIPRLRNPKFNGEPKFVKSFFVNAIKEMNITFDKEA
jgi:cytochrome P450